MLLMVLVALMWSIAGVVTRHLEAAQSFEVTFWRSFFTAGALLLLLPLLSGWKLLQTIRTGGPLLWVSGLCWGGMFTFFMLALTLTSTANVLVMLALAPLFTALAARIFIGHRLPARTWGAIVVAGGGMAYMYASQLDQGFSLLGTFLALCVPLSGAANWTVSQHAHAKGHDLDLMPAVLIGAVFSCLLTLPLAWPLNASGHDLALLGFLGVFQLALPCALAVLCTKSLQAAEIALLGLLEVIFGIALAWVGANEVPGTHVITGASVVMLALAANAWLGRKDRDDRLGG
jgi:drug/metabolite transporter (DMT)-like permease